MRNKEHKFQRVEFQAILACCHSDQSEPPVSCVTAVSGCLGNGGDVSRG